MKIVVKHVDNLKSQYYPEREIVPQFLVYKMTDDNIPVSCKICIGEEEKIEHLRLLQFNHNTTQKKNEGAVMSMLGFTLPIEEVSLDEHLKEVRTREIFD